METLNKVLELVDTKINTIEKQNKRAAVIVINDELFKQMQQEMMYQDMSQKHGTIRSPYSLQVHRGVKVIQSQVCTTVEVF